MLWTLFRTELHFLLSNHFADIDTDLGSHDGPKLGPQQPHLKGHRKWAILVIVVFPRLYFQTRARESVTIQS